MPERPRPDLNRVRDALREHDEDKPETPETPEAPPEDEGDDGDT